MPFEYFTLDGAGSADVRVRRRRRRFDGAAARQDALERDRPRGPDEVRRRGRRADGHDRRRRHLPGGDPAATRNFFLQSRRPRRRGLGDRDEALRHARRRLRAGRHAGLQGRRRLRQVRRDLRRRARRASTGSSCARRSADAVQDPQPQADVPAGHDRHLAAADEGGRRATAGEYSFDGEHLDGARRRR